MKFWIVLYVHSISWPGLATFAGAVLVFMYLWGKSLQWKGVLDTECQQSGILSRFHILADRGAWVWNIRHWEKNIWKNTNQTKTTKTPSNFLGFFGCWLSTPVEYSSWILPEFCCNISRIFCLLHCGVPGFWKHFSFILCYPCIYYHSNRLFV